MKEYTDSIKEWWEQTADSEWYQSRRTESMVRSVLDQPQSAFAPPVFALVQQRLGGFAGKKILVPSAGDCHAAYAFAALGAQVTAADISEKQLQYARSIAKAHGLQMELVQADTMTLEPFADGSFDFVYTSNGVHTWIDDLMGMYRSLSRVLKNGGLSVMWDIHPVQRPFSGERFVQPLIVKAYDDVAPRQHNHWRVMDLVNAMAESRLQIEEMLELSDSSYFYAFGEAREARAADWRQNPMAALPTHICIAARKR